LGKLGTSPPLSLGKKITTPPPHPTPTTPHNIPSHLRSAKGTKNKIQNQKNCDELMDSNHLLFNPESTGGAGNLEGLLAGIQLIVFVV
jgi:hypothetical protein